MASETRRTGHQVTFVVLAASVTAYALLQSLVTPVLPTIQQALHTSQNTVTWVLTAYLLSASIFTPIMGRIGDMVGKRPVFVATLAALAAGSLLAALATNVTVMIIARVVQGIGGGVLPLAFGIVRDEFPREKLSGAVGAIASLVAVGGGLGIVLAGPIVNALDYHWLFWLPMIVTILAAVATFLFVPQSPVRTPGRISWSPAVLLSAWLVALLVALSQAPVWGWGSGKVIGLFAAAVVLAVAWVETERRAATPLIDMKMMARPAVWTNNTVALLFGVGMYAVFAFLPEFVQTPKSTGYGFGVSVTQSGLILAPMAVMMFLVGMGANGLAARIGGKIVVLLGALIGAASMALLAFAHTHTWELYIATAVMGVGFGLAFAAMSSLIVAAVPPAQTGVASGMNANIRTIGGSIGAALMASVVTAHPAADGLPRESGYTGGFAMLGGALLVAALAAVLIPVSRRGNVVSVEGAEDEAAAAESGAGQELAAVPAGNVEGDASH
ncbi:MFS transporter [Actinacidiphila guanduensis]|uniref:Drug resistance transporter, EmrB/QacA subfamily n=1 Tax=Actinacidiphila guanduensis TaxID=310781 RepID=A0A1G9VP33_9ACTN|nr:MFS transporter [Actinacidiphila guanduensis]SDM73887.1 drug resistance transporter, EmrB/QacA subfamily [Actinacidiphila guanduensis]